MARKPRVKKPAKETAKKRGATAKRRAPSALAVVVFLLLAGTAGLAAWLTYSHEAPEHGDQHSQKPVDTTRAVMPLDLSKDGSGEQAAPLLAATSGDGHDEDGHDKKGDDEKSPEQAPADAATAKAGKAEDHGSDKPKSSGHAAKPQPSPAPASKVTAQNAPKVEDEPHKDDGHKNDGHGTDKQKAKPTAGAKPEAVVGTAAGTAAGKPRGSFTRSGGLRPAPDPALVKNTDDGAMPVVADDGCTPLQVYARPYKPTGRPRIAVVVGSLGLSRATTLAAIQQLPGGVTLAFAPYGRTLQDYVNQARAAGHEVLLQAPMEPMDYPTNDPGPHTLLTSLTINRNLKRLDWLLGRFTGYVGVVNFMGGRFTAAESHLLPILEAMHDRGLMFLDARASSTSVAVNVANKIGLDVAANDRVLDLVASRAAIDARLLELERLAEASGGAIGIGFPYPVTIERLAQWTRAMGDRGFDLVPVSALTGAKGGGQ